MIKTLSPYYISTPFVNPTTLVTSTFYTMSLYVWDGDKNTPPATASWTITKQNPTASTGNDKVGVSRILNSLLDFNVVKGTSTALLDGNNQKWVKHEVVYSDDLLTPENETTTLLIRGYGYGNEGENPQTPTDKVMITGDEFNVNRAGFLCLPILLDDI